MTQRSAEPLAIIVAMARNRVIGKDGTLPWHLPEDLKHFKRTTLGHPVIMGRKTYESIGRPLPKRRNIVVTSNRSAAYEGCEVAHDLTEALILARQTDKMPFVIGGAGLFGEALKTATHVHLTLIDEDHEGDVWFPEDALGDFIVTERRPGQTDGVTFLTMVRRC